MKINSLRAALYRLASLLGDINAITRGPVPIAKRLVRKAATKTTMPLLGRLFK